MCPPLPSQLFNTCLTPTSIMGYIIASISALIGIIIIIFILKAKEKQTTHWFLGLFVLGSLTVSISGLITISSTSPERTLFNSRIATAIVSLGNFSFYWFLYHYLKLKNRILLGASVVYYVIILILIILIPNFILSEIFWDPVLGWYDFHLNNKLIWIAFSQYIFVAFGIWKLLSVYQQTQSPRERNRLKYLLLASLSLFTGMGLLYFPKLRPFNPDAIGTILSALLVSMAILKYKLLDISVIVRKGLLYTALTSFVTGFYIFSSFVIQSVFGISQNPISTPAAFSTALFMAFVYQPLQSSTQSVIDRVFFRKPYNPEELLENFSRNISSTIDIYKIAHLIIQTFSDSMKIEKSLLFVYRPNKKRLKLVHTSHNINLKSIPRKDEEALIKYLKKSNELVDVYDNVSGYNNIFKRLKIKVLIPLKSKDELVGIIALGEKLSEQNYTLEDYRLVSTMANQAAIALENSLLFEKVKRQKAKVLKALNKEKELDELKSEFIAIASHNLRTPLTIAEGNLGNLLTKKEMDEKERSETLNTISVALNDLSTLSEQLLIISSEKDKAILNTKEDINLDVLIDESIESYKLSANQKGLELIKEKIKEKLPIIKGDKLKIKIAINNLIDNAIKFTEKGSVSVGASLKDNEVVLSVTDTGPGIPKEEQEKIFEKFHQIRKKTYVYVPGVGLGLYIVKLIIDAHKGKVWVESEEGKGSIFSFSLPMK